MNDSCLKEVFSEGLTGQNVSCISCLMITAIPTAELKVTHLPDAGSTISELFRFALSFNGYEIVGEDECPALADELHAAWRKDSASLAEYSIDDLRNALFFEQRVDHWQSPCGTGDYDFMRAIVRELRSRLTDI